VLLPVFALAQSGVPHTQTGKSPMKAPTKTAPAKAAAPALTTDDEKIIYALGLSISRSISQFDLSPAELDILKRALTDGAAGKPEIDLQAWGPKIQELATQRAKNASTAYLEKAAAQPGAVRTPSGLIYREIVAGTGPSPQATDRVRVNYRGTLINGAEFDSSYKRNAPAEFALNEVIPCWTEGVQRMKVGGKAELVCPSDLAYGDQGRPGIPGGAALVFEIELLDISGGNAPQ